MDPQPFDLHKALNLRYPLVTVDGRSVDFFDTVTESDEFPDWSKDYPYTVTFRGVFGWWANGKGEYKPGSPAIARDLMLAPLPPLSQRDKWLVEGVIHNTLKRGQKSTEVVADVVVARTMQEAMERVFEKRVAEHPGYVLQGTTRLLDMIRTLRKFYDETVAETERRFLAREQS